MPLLGGKVLDDNDDDEDDDLEDDMDEQNPGTSARNANPVSIEKRPTAP